ncbi:MAG TPA: NADH-quinone oxidoreductase subunit C [Bryobacteraceae bacterium]|nr:NADH-quinone oxidoreductase subunit C [Bryobacteraceae bacterium]
MTHAAVLETMEAFGETTLTADPARIVELCRHFKDNEGFVRLSAVTAVDRFPAEPRFEVIYHLHAIDMAQPNLASRRLRLKCRLGGTDPLIDSVTSVWRSADWYEREVFDMFGIKFRNHPNHQRILMPVDWDGYPLRKDYPVHGNKYGYQSE